MEIGPLGHSPLCQIAILLATLSTSIYFLKNCLASPQFTVIAMTHGDGDQPVPIQQLLGSTCCIHPILVFQALTTLLWKLVWNTPSVPKINFFIWTIMHQKLLTGEN